MRALQKMCPARWNAAKGWRAVPAKNGQQSLRVFGPFHRPPDVDAFPAIRGFSHSQPWGDSREGGSIRTCAARQLTAALRSLWQT
jgi:hypothetical protein